MLAATVTFAVSLWYSHALLIPLDERALEIIEDSVPSIEHLTQGRLALMQIGTLLERIQSSIPSDRSVAIQQLRRARQSLIAELRQYRALNPSSDERRLLPELDAELLRLDGAIATAVETATATTQGFNQPLARCAALLEGLERLNANETLSSATEILRLRRRTAQVATLLGLGSLAIAVGVLLLALVVLRGQTRLLNQHAALLAERGAELEAFSARVAHDLRNPLSAMVFTIQAANRDSHATAQFGEVLEVMQRQVLRMNDIIEGLLEFALAGATPTPDAHADVPLVLGDVVDTLRPRAAAAHAELSIDPIDPIQVACTPGALASIAANLIGNAVKFIVESNNSTPRIRVMVKERGEMVRVEVVDNGPGLPAGTEQLIFEPFRRLPGTRQPGIGLGLATVKKFVEAYRGKVGVTSHLGHGSTFWFELPVFSSFKRP